MTAARLLVATPWWPSRKRPWFGTFVLSQAVALERLVPLEVLLCRPPWEQRRRLLAGTMRLRVRTLPVLPKYMATPWTWRLAAYAFSAGAAFGKCSAALVHTEVLAAMIGPALAKAGIPYAVVIHGEDTNRAPSATAGRRQAVAAALRAARTVLLVGSPLRSVLERLAPGVPGTVVENGYDPEVDAMDEPPAPLTHEGPIRLSSVGNLHREKGHEFLVAALLLLHSRNVAFELDIVGDGPMRGRLEEAARCFGGRVRLHGALSPREAASVIARSDLFVLPSSREALGIVFLNALALGRPVVGMGGTGIDGIVEHGINGFLLQREQPKAIADIVESLVRCPAEARRMGAAGRRVAREYSWERNARRVLSQLDGVS